MNTGTLQHSRSGCGSFPRARFCRSVAAPPRSDPVKADRSSQDPLGREVRVPAKPVGSFGGTSCAASLATWMRREAVCPFCPIDRACALGHPRDPCRHPPLVSLPPAIVSRLREWRKLLPRPKKALGVRGMDTREARLGRWHPRLKPLVKLPYQRD